MSQWMQEMADVSRNRPTELRAAKEKGVRIIEHTGSFVPEELIYAAGAKPYLMCRGGEPEPPESPLAYLLRFMNPLARSLAGYHMLGLDPVTPFADLIAFQETDCQVGRVSELMEYQKLPVYKLGVPSDWKKSLSHDYYHRALGKFKNKLEEMTGEVVTEEKLAEQVALSNRIHRGIAGIDALRKRENPPITGYEFIRLNHCSFHMEPEAAAEAIEGVCDALEGAEGRFEAGAPRILLAGHAVALGDYAVPKLIEKRGAMIVAEMLDEGIRHFKWEIDTEGDLLANIAKRNYLEKFPPNIFQPAWKDRFAHMQSIIEDCRIDGVVWYQLAFDEIYDMEAACVAKWLNELGVPFLKLESSYEYSREAMGPLETRIESFIQTIR